MQMNKKIGLTKNKSELVELVGVGVGHRHCQVSIANNTAHTLIGMGFNNDNHLPN